MSGSASDRALARAGVATSLVALGALFCALFPHTKLGFGAVWQFRFALCFIPVGTTTPYIHP